MKIEVVKYRQNGEPLSCGFRDQDGDGRDGYLPFESCRQEELSVIQRLLGNIDSPFPVATISPNGSPGPYRLTYDNQQLKFVSPVAAGLFLKTLRASGSGGSDHA